MVPYKLLERVVESGRYSDFGSAWFDFENWERCRGFADIRSRRTIDELDWIRDLADLQVKLNGFPASEERDRCQGAIENVFLSFSKMDQPDRLGEAMRLWDATRSDEQTS